MVRKALGSRGDRAIEVIAETDPQQLPWHEPWDVAVLSTDALAITDVADDAYIVYVPGETPTRVSSPSIDDLITLVRAMALDEERAV